MITSIYSKSRLKNFIIVFFMMLIAFIAARTELVKEEITVLFVIKHIVLFLLCLVSLLFLNFIARKNNLTDKTNYEIFIFSIFLLLINTTTIDLKILLSNFAVLLGLRRLLNLQTQTDIKAKLYDAALWIAVAALLYFWSIFFFALIVFALIFYTDNNMRHWIIPFIGIATVFVLTIGVSIIFYDGFFEVIDISLKHSYDFSAYNSLEFLIAITLLLSFGLWAMIFYLQTIKKRKKVYRASYKVVLIAALIAFIILIHAPNKNGSEFLFLFAPLAVIIANYVETIQDKWFKEIFMFILFFTPFVLLLL